MPVVIGAPVLPKLDASFAGALAGPDKTRAQLRRNRPDRLFFSANLLVWQCSVRGIWCQFVSWLVFSVGAWAGLVETRAQLSRNRQDRLFFSANPLACQCARRGI